MLSNKKLGMCLFVPFLKRYREEITQVLITLKQYSSTILFLSWLLARQLDFWAWMLCHLSHFLQLYHLKSGFERASVPTTQVKEFFSPGSQLGSYLSRAS
jgi:hypothetical protein